MIYASVAIYIIGGVAALISNDPRIAASTTSIAYVLLLAAWH